MRRTRWSRRRAQWRPRRLPRVSCRVTGRSRRASCVRRRARCHGRSCDGWRAWREAGAARARVTSRAGCGIPADAIPPAAAAPALATTTSARTARWRGRCLRRRWRREAGKRTRADERRDDRARKQQPSARERRLRHIPHLDPSAHVRQKRIERHHVRARRARHADNGVRLDRCHLRHFAAHMDQAACSNTFRSVCASG